MRSCRFCGCTEERACPGGCSWLADDIDVCTSRRCRLQIAKLIAPLPAVMDGYLVPDVKGGILAITRDEVAAMMLGFGMLAGAKLPALRVRVLIVEGASRFPDGPS